jgi:hypothetical protein
MQTVVVGVIAYFALPNSLESVTFLTAEERAFAKQRLANDKPSTLSDNVKYVLTYLVMVIRL